MLTYIKPYARKAGNLTGEVGLFANTTSSSMPENMKKLIHVLKFATDTELIVLEANQLYARYYPIGTGNADRCFHYSGTYCDGVEYSVETAFLASTVLASRRWHEGLNAPAIGYFVGGSLSTSSTPDRDSAYSSNTGLAVSFDTKTFRDITTSLAVSYGGMSSICEQNAGYLLGGWNGSTLTPTIYKFQYSNETTTTLTATTPNHYVSKDSNGSTMANYSVNSLVAGYLTGFRYALSYKSLNKFAFSTETVQNLMYGTTSVYFNSAGTLHVRGSAVNSTTHGYVGRNTKYAFATETASINSLDFSSTGLVLLGDAGGGVQRGSL